MGTMDGFPKDEVSEREKIGGRIKDWIKDPRSEIPNVLGLREDKVTPGFGDCVKVWVDEIISSLSLKEVDEVMKRIKEDPNCLNSNLRPYILSSLVDRILKENGRFEIPEGNWSGLYITVPPKSELRIPEVKCLEIKNYGKICARRIDDLNIRNFGDAEVGEIGTLAHEGSGTLSANRIGKVDRFSGMLVAKEIDRLNLTSIYEDRLGLVVAKEIKEVYIHHTTDCEIIAKYVKDIRTISGSKNYHPRLRVVARRVGNFDSFPGLTIYRGFEKLV